MRTPVLLLVCVLMLFNCGKESDKSKSLFQNFLDTIPKQTLPIHLTCGLPNGTGFLDTYAKYKAYFPESQDRIFGLIGTASTDYHLIVYGYTGDDIYPIVVSYDSNGQRIDSLHLMIAGCGAADEFAIPNAYATVKEDMTIILGDTTQYIHRPGYWEKRKDYIVDSVFVQTGGRVVDSIVVKKEVFRVNSEGKFIKE